MIKIIQIRRRENGRVHYYAVGDLVLAMGDRCVIEAERGIDFGEVISEPENLFEEKMEQPPLKIVRVVTAEDTRQIEANKKDTAQAYEVCQLKIDERKLPMKLVGVEYSFDRSRLLFYFTAEGRVDFRELVKDLAGIFKTRIELRQIGVRDEARMMDGVGRCGRRLCCAAFLRDFEPINIRMAKLQRLPLDPEKISGVCGRLFCCLRYEEEFYRSVVRDFPKDGVPVNTPQGPGKVLDVNLFKRTVTVELEDERKLEFQVADVIPRTGG
ncbi:MAG: stage 0 sporulation family protein [Candidatus Aureabacteria bacterium]|nr:stage 0 sporulation family protein [Candidatus Auribacterota bacterium]